MDTVTVTSGGDDEGEASALAAGMALATAEVAQEQAQAAEAEAAAAVTAAGEAATDVAVELELIAAAQLAAQHEINGLRADLERTYTLLELMVENAEADETELDGAEGEVTPLGDGAEGEPDAEEPAEKADDESEHAHRGEAPAAPSEEEHAQPVGKQRRSEPLRRRHGFRRAG